MSVIGSNVLAGASGQAVGAAGYEIERSLRFNSGDSAYLSKDFSSASNRKTFTFSCWIKRCSSDGGSQYIFVGSNANGTSGDDNNFACLRFLSTDQLDFAGTTTIYRRTNAVYRDFSAWMHIVLAVDTTNSTAEDRIKLYVNGVEIDSFSVDTNPAENHQFGINQGNVHTIGVRARNETTLEWYQDAYLADVHFIDGQALAPTDFGEYDDNNVWQPKEYSGTYGTNGFRLSFSDNTSTTTIAEDSSGNNNDWTANNLSVASGAGNDSLVDSPTNGTQTDTGAGGEVVGNYATLNPLKTVSYALSNGNLDFSQPASGSGTVATIAIPSSGKWYWEITPTHSSGEYVYGVLGEPSVSANLTTASQPTNFVIVNDTGSIYKNSYTSIQSGLPYRATGYVWGIAVDVDANTIQFYVNGATYGSAISTALTSGVVYLPWISSGNNTAATHTGSANFGQRAFAYTAPSGFKALCTTNLTDPTIADGSTAMDVALYTGNGSTQTISGLGFSPDLVWIKNRGSVESHFLHDVVRGFSNGNALELRSNSTNAEGVPSAASTGLTSFNSDGFSLGSDGGINANSNTFVAWTWDGGTSTVSNTDGSITSSVRANASAGFSIVNYTGTGANATIGHGLNAAPEFFFGRNRDDTSGSLDWVVYHKSIGNTGRLKLNTGGSTSTSSTFFQDTSPTSSVISIGTSNDINKAGDDYILHCFAPVAGYSSFGSYTGNGSTDGPFVYTGFRPRWVMVKMSTAGGNWDIFDTSRDLDNVASQVLRADSSAAEFSTPTGTYGIAMDILSNGFKLRSGSATNDVNDAGETFIYAAFAEHSLKHARAR